VTNGKPLFGRVPLSSSHRVGVGTCNHGGVRYGPWRDLMPASKPFPFPFIRSNFEISSPVLQMKHWRVHMSCPLPV